MYAESSYEEEVPNDVTTKLLVSLQASAFNDYTLSLPYGGSNNSIQKRLFDEGNADDVVGATTDWVRRSEAPKIERMNPWPSSIEVQK